VGRTKTKGSGFMLIHKVIDFDLLQVEILDAEEGAVLRFPESFYYISSEDAQLGFRIEK